MKKLLIPLSLLTMISFSKDYKKERFMPNRTQVEMKNKKPNLNKEKMNENLNLEYENRKNDKLVLKYNQDNLDFTYNNKEYKGLKRVVSASGNIFKKDDVEIALKGEWAYLFIDNKLVDEFREKDNKIETSYIKTENKFYGEYRGEKNSKLEVSISDDLADITINGKKYKNLKRVVSASGEIFKDNGIELYMKGNEASIFINDEKVDDFKIIREKRESRKSESYNLRYNR